MERKARAVGVDASLLSLNLMCC